jgi:hypothetical protein
LRSESYHPAPLLSKLQMSVPETIKCFPEFPLTCPTNFLLVYGGARESEGSAPPYALQRMIYGFSPALWAQMKKFSAGVRSIFRWF